MIRISRSPTHIICLIGRILRLDWIGQFDHINQMITISAITLSDFHCYEIKNGDSSKMVIIKKILLSVLINKILIFLDLIIKSDHDVPPDQQRLFPAAGPEGGAELVNRREVWVRFQEKSSRKTHLHQQPAKAQRRRPDIQCFQVFIWSQVQIEMF